MTIQVLNSLFVANRKKHHKHLERKKKTKNILSKQLE